MSIPGPITVTALTLDEIAIAISELGFRREVGELCWPELAPEQTVLSDLFRQRLMLIPGITTNEICNLAALLVLDAMVAQHLHDLRLAMRVQAPFGGGSGA
jgi:hypothetical protein